MLTAFASLAFLQPLMLWALALLPVIWWLLRHTPPRPRRVLFPPIRLLLGLADRQDTPAHSPWWLTLLRMVLAALVILALAEPVLRPDAGSPAAKGPLVLVVDNGWAAAARWADRQAVLRDEIAAARGTGDAVVLAPTAARPGAQGLSLLDPEEALQRVGGLMPLPYAPDRAATLAALRSVTEGLNGGRIVWLGDGIAHPNDTEFAAALADLVPGAALTAYVETPARDALGLSVPEQTGGALQLPVLRPRAGEPRAGRLLARALNGKLIGDAPFTFEASERRATATFELPLELRNEIARVEIVDEPSAGAVRLLDDRWQRRRIGLISGESQEIAQPLLSPLYYVRRALAPFADLFADNTSNLSDGIAAMIDARVSVIVMTDVGTLVGDTQEALDEWIREGGTLVRFAGPRLAAAADELVPVQLRRGGRILGGTLSWSERQRLGAFAPSSPFSGLEIPADVSVERQVLAEPSPDLDDSTWAQLADGTPLVTAAPRGKGRIVLFHVTANTAWSNLPLSGLFVDMLRRIVALAGAPAQDAAGSDAASEGETVALPPIRTLDGAGRLVAPPATAKPAPAAGFAELRAGADHPPGLYGYGEAFRALNVLKEGDSLTPLDTAAAGFGEIAYDRPGPAPLKPWMLVAALMLLFADAAAVLALTGRRSLRPLRAGANMLLGLVVAAVLLIPAAALAARDGGTPQAPQAPQAQQGSVSAADEFLMQASLVTRLAYVAGPDADLNEIARAGLTGLTRVLAERTALEPGLPIGLDIATDELAFFPLIYWPVSAGDSLPDAATLARVDAYMKRGGTILFDTRDEPQRLIDPLTGVPQSPAAEALRRLLGALDIPELQPVPVDHVLTKAFYLLQNFPGRYDTGPLWVEAGPSDAQGGERSLARSDGVSSILVTSNDLAGAWAIDDQDRFMFPPGAGGQRQRELAFRTGINIVIYTLTGNYKADQVHVPALLERLGQ